MGRPGRQLSAGKARGKAQVATGAAGGRRDTGNMGRGSIRGARCLLFSTLQLVYICYMVLCCCRYVANRSVPVRCGRDPGSAKALPTARSQGQQGAQNGFVLQKRRSRGDLLPGRAATGRGLTIIKRSQLQYSTFVLNMQGSLRRIVAGQSKSVLWRTTCPCCPAPWVALNPKAAFSHSYGRRRCQP